MSDEDTTLWVGNLHDKVTEELLFELFLQVGPLESVRIPIKDGVKKNFGFVEFKHACSIPYALEAMKGISLFRKDLKMNHRGSQNGNVNQAAPHSNQSRGNQGFEPPAPSHHNPALLMYGQDPTMMNGQYPPSLMSPPPMGAPPTPPHAMNGRGFNDSSQRTPTRGFDHRDGRNHDNHRQDRGRDHGESYSHPSSEGRDRRDHRGRDDRIDDDQRDKEDRRGNDRQGRPDDPSPNRSRRRRSRSPRDRFDERDGRLSGFAPPRSMGEFGSPPNGFLPMNGGGGMFSPPGRPSSNDPYAVQRERMLMRQNQMNQMRNAGRNHGGFGMGGGYPGGGWDRGNSGNRGFRR